MHAHRWIRLASRAYRAALAARARYIHAGDREAATAVFEVLQQQSFRSGGWPALFVCWCREAWSLCRAGVTTKRALAPSVSRPEARRSSWAREVPMSFLMDCRHAWRALVHTPVFTVTAVLTLALGIGANSAIFSLVDGVLIKALPYPDASQLVAVAELPPSGLRNTVAPLSFLAWQESAQSFAGLAARQATHIVMLDGGDPEEVRAARVSASYFDVLGVPPSLGRTFTPADGQLGAPCVMLLSDRLWGRRWARDRNILGASIRLADGACQVVGVLPPGSAFDRVPFQAYTPMTFTRANAPRGHFLTVIGRLRAGTTVSQADAEMGVLAAAVNREDPIKSGWSARVEPWRDTVVRADSRRLVLVLFGAVGVVLLVACINVASLALVRASARRRDVSIRLALGAGAGRLFSHYLAESLLMVSAGGFLGLIVAQWCLAAFVALSPAGTLPSEAVVALDGRAVLFTGLVIIIVSLAAGSVPAWQSLRATATDALRGESRTTTASTFTRRTQSALLTIQVALAMVLVTGAAMLGVSFARLTGVDPGFDPGGLVTFRLSAPPSSVADEPIAMFHADVLDELRRQPATASAGGSTSLPLRGWLYGTTVRVEGVAPTDPARMNAHVQHVVGDYFSALGIPLKQGRAFTDTDQRSPARVAIVNETFVRRFIGEGPALGRHLHLGIGDDGSGRPPAAWDIVGVIRDVKTGGLADDVWLTPEVYVPLGQAPMPTVSYVVRARSSGDAVTLDMVRRAVERVDTRVPISAFETGDVLVDDSVVLQRFRTMLMMAFAGLTLVIAVIGVYAIRAQAVTARLREVGIRLALGATRSQVMHLVVGQGLRLVSAGVALGLVASYAARAAIRQWLFGVDVYDAFPLVLAIVTLGGAALVASWLPARRATRVSALESLRHE